jgi:hypothetical protein
MLPETENSFDHTTVLATALVLACCVPSFSYRTYLARDFSAAAKTACSEQNTLSGAYETCLIRLSKAATLTSQGGIE